MANLIPVIGCLVTVNERVGYVSGNQFAKDTSKVDVLWQPGRDTSTVPLDLLQSAFKMGMEVEHKPDSAAQKSLGYGTVLKTREIAGFQQLLVEFPESSAKHWLPFERLAYVQSTQHRFVVGNTGSDDSAERFRLKFLAHTIENWNENTGALSHLGIDPLPHQIDLVHKILNHGNRNWLIADDVGLGKTIETGMLIKALIQRDLASRILIITPAGLTRQWKEDELYGKFKLGEFKIYGENFTIDTPRDWYGYNNVIASIDRLKEPEHLDSIMQADNWDLIIFDETHRLSRTLYGNTYEESQRYNLARKLRKKTDSLILLSATPHQGKEDKFHALLHLLRPELKDKIDTLELNPQILNDMMLRNNKADVTDKDGKFIFVGKRTHAIRVEINDEAKDFDQALQSYLKQGYAQARQLGKAGNAIGFVMTVYRKLAASSVQAIYNSLVRRKARLEGMISGEIEYAKEDERYAGEFEEISISQTDDEFFAGELPLLEELIERCQRLIPHDRKLKEFMSSMLHSILNESPNEKVLIFTEYRSTQDYIQQALAQKFGVDKVELINGSMKAIDRREAIKRFEGNGQFLISTEAGGEGINLQSQCHIMVNYDLPWNPMRLVQRIGRLYRYGQKKVVLVFNIHSPTTADEKIISLMYERINQVVKDLATVGDEYNERLGDDILGQVADLADMETILNEAPENNINRTQERINDALFRAKDAANKQRDLFENASSYNPENRLDTFEPSKFHIYSFVEGMFGYLNIEIVEKTNASEVWHVRLPENLMEKLGVRRSRWSFTLNDIIAAQRADIEILDMDHFLMQHFIKEAKSYTFSGQTAVIQYPDSDGAVIASAYLRWQNDCGKRQKQEFITWVIQSDGSIKINPSELYELTAVPLANGTYSSTSEKNKQTIIRFQQAAGRRLTELSNNWLQPDNVELISAGWFEVE
ncbi:MAG: helicase [Oceanospirillaceae bacterium]|uniref:DEAD/DEAH box helicase n=1 Tax=unclassified Thalassolituus TaxID=2624967 RepID=UPI000C43BFE5|nr:MULTISPECIES: helicase-related protein [unclassified Thalassolituus]MAS24461.1 helicase [Oceanospirillaceae bacterium]MAX99759.1 helicase [Oceanospirillaceae bacterium]MBL36426.1 helicase [Oceanospirillaceae bacterium]MBS51428.1 helicase [Oceanospirillaceae bacterium]|tara:strand:- start:1618 stop:4422 length:2805 start_codon:yes stop_codon:yes gene_type:complete